MAILSCAAAWPQTDPTDSLRLADLDGPVPTLADFDRPGTATLADLGDEIVSAQLAALERQVRALLARVAPAGRS